MSFSNNLGQQTKHSFFDRHTFGFDSLYTTKTEMLSDFRFGGCYPTALVVSHIALTSIDGLIAFLAFYQGSYHIGMSSLESWSFFYFKLIRIHSRTSNVGWTRQKVFHLMIGSSNVGYFMYFILTPVAGCKRWLCWLNSCGFILMASPDIILLSAFLLLLSYWIDLCHQSNDEDDEDEGSSSNEALLEKTNKPYSNTDAHIKYRYFRFLNVGSRQKVVILVAMLLFASMMTSAGLIWIEMVKNSKNSLAIARVYIILFAIAMLSLGGAMTYYGVVLLLRMRHVRSERASSEMWKVASLATVSFICFTLRTFVALFTDLPLLYQWHRQNVDDVYYSLFLILYYFIGSSAPSLSVLLVMRELPSFTATTFQDSSRAITDNRPGWTVGANLQNQVPSITRK